MNPRAAVVAAVAAVVAIVGAGLFTFGTLGGDAARATAYFEKTTGLYPGDDVRVLGVSIGKVDAVRPEGTRVRVDFHYDAGRKVPHDAMAAIVAPSLVTGRYIQLAPVYRGGPVLAEGAVIPVERTAIPVEWDQIKTELTQFTQAIGPHGANAEGALRTLVDGAASAFDGNGQRFSDTVASAAAAASALSGNRENLFATVRNLNKLITALNANDAQLKTFSTELASIAALLKENRGNLTTLLKEADAALSDITRFVERNRDRFGSTVDGLASVADQLADNRMELANILHLAPTTLANFYNIYNPTTGAFTGRATAPYSAGLSNMLCQTAFSLGGTLEDCQALIGPIVDQFPMADPPVTLDPANQSGTPNQREPGEPDPQTEHSRPAGPDSTDGGGLSDLLIPGSRPGR